MSQGKGKTLAMVITGALIPHNSSLRQASAPNLPKNSHSRPKAIPLTHDVHPQNRGSNAMTQAIIPASDAVTSHPSEGKSFVEMFSLKALHALDRYHQVQDNLLQDNYNAELYGVDEYA